MFQIMTELHVNKEDIFLILKTQSFDTKVTKFQTRMSRSVDIQIRPTFDLYCRLRNSFNFDQNMMFEWARLKTYKSAPETLCAWKIKLAKSGFFYTGVDHKCKCAFCGFSYDVSSETGDPDDVHRRLNPSCPFLVDRVNTNNIAIDADERALFQRRSPAFLTSSSRNFQYPAVFTGGHVSRFQTGGYAIDLDSTEEVDSYVRLTIQGLQVPPNEDRQISNTSDRENRQRGGPTNFTKNKSPVSKMCERPKYPQYDSISIRLGTFRNWPTHLTQSPREMASAGFFYAGIEDHCRCFFCGGGLRNWEPGDQPWVEHARWYHNCAFVRESRGDKFIGEVQSNGYQPILQESENLCSRRSDLTTTDKNQVTNDFRTHPAVLSVNEFGYSESVIKKAFDLLQAEGTKVITGTTLLEAVFTMEENTTRHESNYTLKTGHVEQSELSSHAKALIKKPETTTDQNLELSIRSLEEENQNLKDQNTCKICLDEPIAIVFLPCGHMASCANCAPALRRCPICRVFIKGTVKAIMC